MSMAVIISLSVNTELVVVRGNEKGCLSSFWKKGFFSGRMFYICPGKTGAMKRIVLVIFLLGIIVWGWSTVREDLTLAEGTEKTQPMPASEARQDVDRLIGVLREANRLPKFVLYLQILYLQI